MGTTIIPGGTDEHHKAEFENKNRTRQSHVSLDRRYGCNLDDRHDLEREKTLKVVVCSSRCHAC